MSNVDGIRRAIVLLAAAALAAPALAHGPTRQKVVESIDIAAPPEKVWALVGDFAGWQKWHPAIEDSTADKGNAVGSQRRLKIKGRKFLDERLESYDAGTMTIKYRITGGDALPVTNYSSNITISKKNDGSTIVWQGAFYRGYPNNDPPPDQNDEAAIAAVTGVYKTGLGNLKAVAER
jgi:carbon monoxide dehydrogenase subunit G